MAQGRGETGPSKGKGGNDRPLLGINENDSSLIAGAAVRRPDGLEHLRRARGAGLDDGSRKQEGREGNDECQNLDPQS